MNKEVITKITDFLDEHMDNLNKKQGDIEPYREKAIIKSREILVRVRQAFKYIYKKDLNAASNVIGELLSMVDESLSFISTYDDEKVLEKIYNDPLREYVELLLLYSFVSGDADVLDRLKDIKSEVVLDGYVDFVGELGRLVQNYLLDGICERASEVIDLIEEIYLTFMATPLDNYIYRDYKRKVDRMRGILERVKSDFLYRCGKHEY